MPARIYALAKELNLDSKDLVDIVQKVGIAGKGSALASLTDGEAKKVRDFLSTPDEKASPASTPHRPTAQAPSGPVSAVRDSITPESRRPKTLDVGRSKKAGSGKEAENRLPDSKTADAASDKSAAADSSRTTAAGNGSTTSNGAVADPDAATAKSSTAGSDQESSTVSGKASKTTDDADAAKSKASQSTANSGDSSQSTADAKLDNGAKPDAAATVSNAAADSKTAIDKSVSQDAPGTAASDASIGSVAATGPVAENGTGLKTPTTEDTSTSAAASSSQSASGGRADAGKKPIGMSAKTSPDDTPASAKSDSGKSDSAKSDSAKSDSAKSDSGKSDTSKPDSANSGDRKRAAGGDSAAKPSIEKTKSGPAQPVKKGGLASRIASRMAARKPTTDSSGAAVRSETSRGSGVTPSGGGSGGSGGGKIRSLDSRGGSKRADGAAKDSKRGPGPRINVKMASLPDPAQPAVPKSAPGEPKAQKPDVKLSADALAGGKQGVRESLDKIEKEEIEKKRAVRRAGGGLAGFTAGKAEDEDKKKKRLAGMASPRAERGGRQRSRNISLDRSGGGYDRRPRRSSKRKGVNTAAPRKEAVSLELPATIRSFSEAAGVPVGRVLGTIMKMGIPGVNINSQLDFESAEMIAAELDLEIQLSESETLEDSVISELEAYEDDPDSLVPRAPIVTFLGHVDHGKTSLLDYLIGIDVVSGEAGGITQHIRAYEIEKDGRTVTFVDTPGHEAFTEMRARGANVTDIAVLVVAADDGIMPQTEEAISHAKAAEVPIVVALNKIDLEGIDQNRTLTQLTEHQLTPSEWGGDVEVVRTSATKGIGMDELLETLLTIAELNEYSANPDRAALGVCLESEQQGDRGVEAKLVVQNGTLHVGDIVVCGSAHGRIRAMNNPLTGKPVTVAGPSTPVNVLGFDEPPGAGARFHVLDDIAKAREIAESRHDASSQESLSGVTTKVSFENFQEMLLDGRLGQQEEKVKLNLIVRADVKGSLEAIDKELSKFDHPEVEIRVLQRSVGGVSLADVTLASASDAVICAFNVVPDEQARSLADQRNVQIRRYDVIYKLTDEIKAMIEGRLKPEERVVELGRAVVKQTFNISKAGTIAGCYVASGSIQRNCRIRVTRDGRVIGDYPLDSLKRIKEDVKEVPRGMECGIKLSGFNDVKRDDVLEAYKVEEVARTLD